MNIYFLSGLGADKRAFEKLKLPAHWNIFYIDWLEVDKGETLKSYCYKMAIQINTSQPFILVGLSFGGILAVELSKILRPRKIIIISSISTKNELPELFKFFGKTKVNKLVPSFFLNKYYPFTGWFFGKRSKEENELLKTLIESSSPTFLKWAINEILNWENEIRPKNLYHIHGTADKIFPISKTEADVKVNNGGHSMVYNKADEISKILIDAINN